jgi:hypothetical protein
VSVCLAPPLTLDFNPVSVNPFFFFPFYPCLSTYLWRLARFHQVLSYIQNIPFSVSGFSIYLCELVTWLWERSGSRPSLRLNIGLAVFKSDEYIIFYWGTF